MQHIQPLHSHHVTLAGKRWEHDVGCVGLHHLANFVQSAQEDGVNLGRRDLYILNEDPDSHGGVVQPLLRHLNRLLGVPRDEDIVRLPAMRVRGAVAVHLRERRRKIDGCSGGRLDQLDILPVAAADNLMNRKFQLDDIHYTTELLYESTNIYLTGRERGHSIQDGLSGSGLGLLRVRQP